MQKSTGIQLTDLKVDGGASANSLLMQFQADILGINIERPKCVETTALGAAYLAGLSLGVYSSLDEIKQNRTVERLFTPERDEGWRDTKMAKWRKAVKRSLSWIDD